MLHVSENNVKNCSSSLGTRINKENQKILIIVFPTLPSCKLILQANILSGSQRAERLKKREGR
jgi:hypothetical protein